MKNKFEEERETSRPSKKKKKHFSPYRKDKYSINKLNGYDNYLDDLDIRSSNIAY